jgi:hypothetical protein
LPATELKPGASNGWNSILPTRSRLGSFTPPNIKPLLIGIIEGAVHAPILPPNHEYEESDAIRRVAAEIRSAFTYVTIAHLAYDIGQIERGDQSYKRAYAVVCAVKEIGPKLSFSGREFITSQLQLLEPLLRLCAEQRANFDPVLRQPSLN